MKLERRSSLRSLIALGALLVLGLTGNIWADPIADKVSPQRLTLYVGRGDHRVRIEGGELDRVDKVVVYDTSTTGREVKVEEIKTRILNASEDVMTVILRADRSPSNGQRLQLALIFGHQGYMIPANVFQMDVR